MEIRKYESPFECGDAVELWAEIFGREEALLEKPQVDGTEKEQNRDVIYIAYENGKAVGTVHATFPKGNSLLCGISGMCTHPSVRGTGLGRLLFEKIIEEADASGAEYMFLGTENLLAAKLYHSCGFSFLPGSNVMVRYKTGDRADMDRRFFGKKPEKTLISEGNPSVRIPLIPFVLHRGPHFLMDINAGIFNSDSVTQVSCMGLYPRYADIADKGGKWYFACDEAAGIPGALLSELPAGGRMRTDFFYACGFREEAEKLIDEYASDRAAVFTVSERDEEKQQLLLRRGFRKTGRTEEKVREFTVPCLIFEK